MAFAHKISPKLASAMRQVWDQIAMDCFEDREFLYRKDVIELVFDADRVWAYIDNHYSGRDEEAMKLELKAVLAQTWPLVLRSATPVFPTGRYSK